MKRLSDYEGDEAIELWADLLEPIARILADEQIKELYQSGKPKLLLAKEILKSHKADAEEIINRIDPTPFNALTLGPRVFSYLAEIEETEELKDFFDTGEQAKTDGVSFGSATENTEGAEV